MTPVFRAPPNDKIWFVVFKNVPDNKNKVPNLYFQILNEVGIQILEMSVIRMVKTILVCKWYGIWMLFKYRTNLFDILIVAFQYRVFFVWYSNGVQYLNVSGKLWWITWPGIVIQK